MFDVVGADGKKYKKPILYQYNGKETDEEKIAEITMSEFMQKLYDLK